MFQTTPDLFIGIVLNNKNTEYGWYPLSFIYQNTAV